MTRISELYTRLKALFAALIVVLAFNLVTTLPAHAAPASNFLQVVKTFPEVREYSDGVVGKEQLVGARFQIRKLESLPATTPEELGTLIVEHPELLTARPGVPTGEAKEAVTDSAGVALFSGLDDGIYQVIEPSRRNGDEPELLAAPFLVLVDKRVTPVRTKIQPPVVELTADKTVADWGDEIAYTVSAMVPDVDVNGKLSRAAFFDLLDPRLDFMGILAPTIKNLDGEVTLETSDYSVTEEENQVQLRLSKLGLEKLAGMRAGHPETRLSFVLNTRVNTPIFWGMKISNVVYFSPDGYCPASTQGQECGGGYSAISSAPAVVKSPVFGRGAGLVTGLLLPILLALGLASLIWEPAQDFLGDQPPVLKDSSLINEIEGKLGVLASTGANVIWLLAVALMLIVGGLFLVLRRRKRRKDEEIEKLSVNSSILEPHRISGNFEEA